MPPRGAGRRCTTAPAATSPCAPSRRRRAPIAGDRGPGGRGLSGAGGAILLGARRRLWAGATRRASRPSPRRPWTARTQIVVWAPPAPTTCTRPARRPEASWSEVGEPGPSGAGALPGCTRRPRDPAGAGPPRPGPGRGPQRPAWPDLIGAICAYANAPGASRCWSTPPSELPPRDLIRRLLDLGAAGVIVSGRQGHPGAPEHRHPGRPAGPGSQRAPEQQPLSAIGRPMKVGKEELCGLVAAVERFFALDERSSSRTGSAAHAHRRRRPGRGRARRPG